MTTTLSVKPSARQLVPATVIAVASWITLPIPHTAQALSPRGAACQGGFQPRAARHQAVPCRGLRGKCLVQKAVTRQTGCLPTFGGALGSKQCSAPQLVHRCVLPAPHGADVHQLLLPVWGLPAWCLWEFGAFPFLIV